ncbi:MAG: hypothetical protein Kow00108_16120 [Calditrichia bacterium]
MTQALQLEELNFKFQKMNIETSEMAKRLDFLVLSRFTLAAKTWRIERM